MKVTNNQQEQTSIEKDKEIEKLTEQLAIERHDADVDMQKQKEILEEQVNQNEVLRNTLNQTLQIHTTTKEKYDILKAQYQDCISLYQNQEQLLLEAADTIEAKDKRISLLLQTIDEMNETLGEVKMQIDHFIS